MRNRNWYILLVGNKEAKNHATSEIKDFYDNKDFKQDDVYDVAVDTDKEKELFDYADIEKEYNNYCKKYDFDMEL